MRYIHLSIPRSFKSPCDLPENACSGILKKLMQVFIVGLVLRGTNKNFMSKILYGNEIAVPDGKTVIPASDCFPKQFFKRSVGNKCFFFMHAINQDIILLNYFILFHTHELNEQVNQ